MKLRLDKLLCHRGRLSRTEAAAAIRKGQVQVDGVPERSPAAHIDTDTQTVTLQGEVIRYEQYVYLMLNKPDGYVSATDDPREQTVLELLPPEYKKRGLFPCGRQDKHTLGLMILTDDGALAHALLSPKSHAEKVYRYRASDPLSEEDRAQLEAGVLLSEGYRTLPCRLRIGSDPTEGYITLIEGKYHQIKRMFAAIGNHIDELERVSFGGIPLDPALPRGAFRPLSGEELSILKNAPTQAKQRKELTR